jgi:hypothetical protein
MWLVTRIFLCSIFFVVGVDCQGGGGGGGGGAIYGLGNYSLFITLSNSI